MKRNYKSPLLRLLKKVVNETVERSSDTEKIIQDKGRREFIRNSSMAAIGVGLSPALLSSCANSGGAEELLDVAIIGGGIAGLHAGHLLKKNNFGFKIFEATEKTGGRIFTVYDKLGKNTSTELGGEFIDSNHEDMLNLAKEFGLGLLDMEKDVQDSGLIKDTYFFDGKHYTEKEIISAFAGFAKKIEADINLVEEEDEAALAKFDMISIDAYLAEKGITGWLYEMLTKAYTSEMGMDSSKQSALNMLYMLDTDTTGGFKVFGDSDERYKIEGGNGKLIEMLTDALKGNIETNSACQKIELDREQNRYAISFASGKKVKATYLLIAIPFTALRKVELLVELPEEKKRAINELGYGTSSKLIVGFNKQFWRGDGFSGYLFSDIVQNGWDSSAGQNNNAGEGSYTVFLGGEVGAGLEESASDTYLQQLYKIFPSTSNGFNNNKVVYNWSKNPNVNGGYASYAVGQWSSIAGHEQTSVGNMFFAGEHCSEDFQGYMNGGAETGRVAAEGIIEAMKPR